MKRKFLIPLFLLLAFPFKNFAQQKFDKIDFTEVDKFARSVKPDDDLERLTQTLTSPYSEEVLKLRSIFIWVTNNIDYDVDAYNSEKYKQISFKCKNPADCAEKWKAIADERIETALKKHKAVCGGYSELMKRMCTAAGIKCDVVSGYSKTKPYEVGIPLNVTHAWNVVTIDSIPYCLDATWAAGGCFDDIETGKIADYKKHYNNYYWLTPTDNFLRNHYPANKKWLYKEGYTKEMFFDAPFYSPQIIGNINLLSPSSGVLRVKAGDTVHFRFTDEEKFNYFQANYTGYVSPMVPHRRLANHEILLNTRDSALIQRAKFIPFTHKGNVYEFDFIVPEQTIYFIEVLFDFRSALKFRVHYDG